jgi:glycosyltransferase involved in cell wall biosynthesis
MRISHVITRLIIGGAQENTISTVLGLAKIPGVSVDLISGPTTGPEGSLVSSLPPGMLTILPELVRPVHPWADYRAYLKLTRLFQDTRPRIVHTHSGKAGVIGRLAARRAGVPTIIHTIHGPSFGAFQGILSNFLFTNAERLAGRATTHFISVADAMTRQYLEAGIGRPQQYTRVFSGFALQPYLEARNDVELRARLGIGPRDFVVGSIARLFKLKGHDDILNVAGEICRQCPDLKFLWVGGGPWRERLEARIRNLGLADRFVFTGLVPPSEVHRYVGIMDALAHLSRREGLPRALPQALAAGKPVVAYDCDGAREVCLEGQTGFLVAVNDTATLSSRLVELCRNASLRHRLGEAGREFVRTNFSEQTMVDAIWRVYRQVDSQVEQSEQSVARR